MYTSISSRLQIYAKEMRERRDEERKRLEREERVRLRKEERAKTIFDRVKERFTTPMQQARRERLDRQRKEEAALKRKAFLGDKAAKELLLERKMQRFSYSVMSNQKWAFNLKVCGRDHKIHTKINNNCQQLITAAFVS